MFKKFFISALFCLVAANVYADEQISQTTGIPECDKFIQYSDQLLSIINKPELDQKVQAGIASMKKELLDAKTPEEKAQIGQTCSKAFSLLSDAVTKNN